MVVVLGKPPQYNVHIIATPLIGNSQTTFELFQTIMLMRNKSQTSIEITFDVVKKEIS